MYLKKRLLALAAALCFAVSVPLLALATESDLSLIHISMLSWISSFGAQVQVLQPESLREDLLRQAKLLLSYYEET